MGMETKRWRKRLFEAGCVPLYDASDASCDSTTLLRAGNKLLSGFSALSKLSDSPNWLCGPGENILEGHLLPEEPLLLDVEVAGGEVLEVGECPRGQCRVDARWNRQGRAWKKNNSRPTEEQWVSSDYEYGFIIHFMKQSYPIFERQVRARVMWKKTWDYRSGSPLPLSRYFIIHHE